MNETVDKILLDFIDLSANDDFSEMEESTAVGIIINIVREKDDDFEINRLVPLKRKYNNITVGNVKGIIELFKGDDQNTSTEIIDISIKGSGTPAEVRGRLKDVISRLETISAVELNQRAVELEDETLFTTITLKDYEHN